MVARMIKIANDPRFSMKVLKKPNRLLFINLFKNNFPMDFENINVTMLETTWLIQTIMTPGQNPKITPVAISMSGIGRGSGGMRILTNIKKKMMKGDQIP